MGYKPDSCANDLANISRTTCSFDPKLIKGFLVLKNAKTTVLVSDLQDKLAVQTLIANNEAYYFPRIVGVNADNTPDVSVSQNEYGSSYTGSLAINTSISFKISTSQCMMKNLESWNNVSVGAFPIYEDGSIGYDSVDVNGVAYAKGTESLFIFRKPKYRTNISDEFKATMIWIADNDSINESVNTDFALDLDGLVDACFVVDTAVVGQLDFTLSEACNGTPISGLLTTDFVVTDATNAIVAHTMVDNGDGTYTLAFVPDLTAGTYSVGFSSVSVGVVGSDTLFAGTAVTFTV